MITRVSEIEKSFFSKNKLRCFISYRFNELSTEILQLKEFLSLIEIEIVTGNDYEPRRISEKVLGKIDESIDFVICLISTNGESLWTRDEIASISQKGGHVVPIIERGASFQGGIFGDLEYIEYEPGHISDSFVKLLQGVRYIKSWLLS